MEDKSKRNTYRTTTSLLEGGGEAADEEREAYERSVEDANYPSTEEVARKVTTGVLRILEDYTARKNLPIGEYVTKRNLLDLLWK